MPVRSDEPLRKVTLNLYEADCAWLEKTYGHGWTERVRQHIHNAVQQRNHPFAATKRPTLGDLADEG